MARPITASWTKLIVLLGDGGGTEVFATPCGLTTKAINFAGGHSEIAIQDCASPDAPAWFERAITTMSATIPGSGILDLNAFLVWRTWFFSGLAKNCRVKIDVPLAQNGGHFAGAYILTAFDLSGSEADGKIRVPTLTLLSDGPVTWVPASA